MFRLGDEFADNKVCFEEVRNLFTDIVGIATKFFIELSDKFECQRSTPDVNYQKRWARYFDLYDVINDEILEACKAICGEEEDG